jgi:hypothetical protein
MPEQPGLARMKCSVKHWRRAADIVQMDFLEAQCDFAQFSDTNAAELRAWLSHLLFNNLANFGRPV